MPTLYTAYGLLEDDSPEMTRTTTDEHELSVSVNDDLVLVSATTAERARSTWADVKAAIVANA